MYGRGFMSLDRREDVHRIFPEPSVHRENFGAELRHAKLPGCERREHVRIAVVHEIGMYAADPDAHPWPRGHVNVEQRLGQQRRIAQIAEKPAERIERRSKMDAASPQSAPVR